MFLMFQEVCDFLLETSTDKIVQSLMFFWTNFLNTLSLQVISQEDDSEQNKGRQRQITELLPVIRDGIRSQYRG